MSSSTIFVQNNVNLICIVPDYQNLILRVRGPGVGGRRVVQRRQLRGGGVGGRRGGGQGHAQIGAVGGRRRETGAHPVGGREAGAESFEL